MKDTRPDPDQLLRTASRELHGRGHLRIFFGACAGVGKTCAMLVAARRQREQGGKVMAGAVDAHGREDVGRLLEGFPRLARRATDHRQRAGAAEAEPALAEFDVDAALACGCDLVLVEDLAHANRDGSRHLHRWGDVEALLAAGIDVYATLNVHDLESVADIASRIVGAEVRGAVPDRVFDDATDVVLVDLPADDLVARRAAGAVAAPGPAQPPPLSRDAVVALRELALRRVADRVNAEARRRQLVPAVGAARPVRPRLMICVTAATSQGRLITEGHRMARRLGADCLVVHVKASRDGGEQRECLEVLARHAEALKIEFLDVAGDDVIATLTDLARANDVTTLVLGYGIRGWRRPPWRRATAERIAGANPDLVAVLLATGREPRRTRRGSSSVGEPPWSAAPLALATLACALTTLVAAALFTVFDAPNLVTLFVLAVVVVSLRLGRAAAVWAALLSVASFDFFFIPPQWSFAMSDTQYLFTFALILVIALVASELGNRLRTDARSARAGERREATVARVARELSGAIRSSQIVTICDAIAPLFEAEIALILPDRDDRLAPTRAAGFEDLSVAQWAYDHVARAGRGTDTLSGAGALYLPLKAPIGCRGVLAIRPRDWKVLQAPDDKRLLDACCASIALALERIHFADVAQETLISIEGERLRNSLLAAVSHDLRTPLTAIRGLAETLENGADLPAGERTEVASAIRHQADGLQRVVTNLLDLARMQGAGVRLNSEWQSLSEILSSAIDRLGRALDERRISVDLPADLPLVNVDAALIERVFVNLLDNAVKYTPPDARISFAARAVGDSMYCVVEDNGHGLPSGDPERLFEAFVRGHEESAITGVGLGLALCRSIVAAHGGTIRAEAAQPHGARFEIRLPLGAPPGIRDEQEEDAA